MHLRYKWVVTTKKGEQRPQHRVGVEPCLPFFGYPFGERFTGLGLTGLAGFAASDPVVTPFSLAGFAGGRRPQAPGRRTPIPAAFRLAPAVS
jgi:hypothetical protein